MKTSFTFLILASLGLAACHNNPADTSATNSADTTVVTKTDVTNTPAPDTMQVKTATASIPDSVFLEKAYNIGTFEIKMARLANQKSKNAKVKEFADMMIKDHTAMGKDVSALISKKHYTKPNALPADLESKYEDLSKLSGKEFDKKYADINADGHKEAIDLFTKVSTSTEDADVKKLATDALPKLQTHESHATMLQTEVSGM